MPERFVGSIRWLIFRVDSIAFNRLLRTGGGGGESAAVAFVFIAPDKGPTPAHRSGYTHAFSAVSFRSWDVTDS